MSLYLSQIAMDTTFPFTGPLRDQHDPAYSMEGSHTIRLGREVRRSESGIYAMPGLGARSIPAAVTCHIFAMNLPYGCPKKLARCVCKVFTGCRKRC